MKITKNDKLRKEAQSSIVVDSFRGDVITRLAEEQGRSPEEMLKIILDRGLDWWAENVGGFLKEERM